MHRLLSTPCISEGMAPFHITGGTFHGILQKACEVREVTWDQVNPLVPVWTSDEKHGLIMHTRVVLEEEF